MYNSQKNTIMILYVTLHVRKVVDEEPKTIENSTSETDKLF